MRFRQFAARNWRMYLRAHIQGTFKAISNQPIVMGCGFRAKHARHARRNIGAASASGGGVGSVVCDAMSNVTTVAQSVPQSNSTGLSKYFVANSR